jgi:RNA polymerase sigma-70 factor, ECF subfamily
VSSGIDSVTVDGLDVESREWVSALGQASGRDRHFAEARLHAMLLRVARGELRRRSPSLGISGAEVDDVAHQAAADAMMAILSKLTTFRGESRFTTWAYRFVMLEVSTKLGRHFWREHGVSFDSGDWDRLPDHFGVHPAHTAEARDLAATLRTAVETELTERQRQAFVAIVVNGTPLDAVVVEFETNRNAVYKMMFDARRKLRAALVAKGYLSSFDARHVDE